MDVLKHITERMEQCNWSLNHLARQSGVPQSTLSGLYQRGNTPTIPTLEQRSLLDKWQTLSRQKKDAIWALMEKL